MKRSLIKSQMPLDKLLAEARLLSYKTDDTGVKMAVPQSRKIDPKQRNTLPTIFMAIDEVSKVTGLEPLYYMVNILTKDCNVGIHTDSVIDEPVRYHLPIQTNEKARFWDASMPAPQNLTSNQLFPAPNEFWGEHMPLGYWWGPIRYYINHTIWNGSDEERIHLIVDLKRNTVKHKDNGDDA